MRGYTHPRTSPEHSSEWAFTLGQLSTKDAEQDRRISKLEENREKDKAETDRLKTWAERGALLVVLYAFTMAGHATAPTMGPIIGAVARGVIAGLRGG